MKVIYKFLNQFIVYASSDIPIANGFDELIIWTIGISTGLAVVGASVCLIKIMVADDTKQVAEAKGELKQIAIAWVILNMLGALINTVFEIVGTIEI